MQETTEDNKEEINKEQLIQIKQQKLNYKFNVNQIVWTDFGYAKITEFQNKDQKEINLEQYLIAKSPETDQNPQKPENKALPSNQENQVNQENSEKKAESENAQKNPQNNTNNKYPPALTKEGQQILNQIVTLSNKKESHCSLHIPLRNLHQTISIKVKTFFGNRSKFLLQNLDIHNLQISQIKQQIIQASGQDDKLFYNKRLIYPMAQILNLEDQTSLADNNIPNNAQLIFLVQQSFYWNPQAKGEGLLLSNNNLTVKKPAETNYQIILGNLPLRAGKTYFEIKIENTTQIEEEGDDILIGLARKDIDLNIPYSEQRRKKNQKLQKKKIKNKLEQGEFAEHQEEINEQESFNNDENNNGLIWGYLPLRAEKVGPDFNYQPYGNRCRKGDTVGVLFEFKSGLGTVSFYKNKEKFDLAFNNLTGIFYPAVSLPYGEFQITLDPKAQPPL